TYVDDRLRNRGVDGRNGDSLSEDLDREPMSSEVEEESDATVEVAERLSEGFFGYELDPRQKKLAGSAVHYGFGTAVGAVYAAAAEYSPKVTRGDGVPFGAALMVVSDEVAVPALGLSQPPREKPLSTHLYALCSHAVYGFVLETLRRSVRKAL
ncbi:MAG: DUF1440 domain-containing protein, partial [Vicinamibacteria bacterium]